MKSRRLTDILRSEEQVLLTMAVLLEELADIMYPSVATEAQEKFITALDKYRKGMLVYDDMDVGE